MKPTEEKLKEVFGNYFDIANDLMDEYGWISIISYYTYFPQNVQTKTVDYETFVRPKELELFAPYFISKKCIGEKCSICDADATNKLSEEISFDDPNRNRHNLTAYVCREHFMMIMCSAV